MTVRAIAEKADPFTKKRLLDLADRYSGSNSRAQGAGHVVLFEAADGAGHRVLVSLLDGGEWEVQGDELRIKVTASAAVIDMSLSAEAKRLLTATASQILGRPVKLRVVPGSEVQPAPTIRRASNGGSRSRVEQNPVVRRMQEKFGAEIRTVIDYREKR